MNDKIIGTHVGGHLPFEIDISNAIYYDEENRITVAVNNTMTAYTIPPGNFAYIQNEYEGTKQYPDG